MIARKILSLINEGKEDRYLQMGTAEQFRKSLLNGKEYKPVYDNDAVIFEDRLKCMESSFRGRVKTAIEVLKKDNIIVWFLRIVRIMILNNFTEDAVVDKSKWVEECSLKSGLKPREFVRQNLLFWSSDLLNSFRHYLLLGAPEIDNYDYGYKTLEQVFDDFRTIERKWNESFKRFVPASHVRDITETLIRFDNGWEWQNLNEDGNKDEARAMSHCATGGHRGDVNFSLREPVKVHGVSGWKPHLTFIYNKETRFLGERKGFANSKPTEEFHHYIIPLLRHEMVDGMDVNPVNGYKPENNFQLTDLPESEQEALIKEKPMMAPLGYKALEGGKYFEIFEDQVEQILLAEEGESVTETFFSKKDVPRKYYVVRQEPLEYFIKYTCGDNSAVYYAIAYLNDRGYVDRDVSDWEAEQIWEELSGKPVLEDFRNKVEAETGVDISSSNLSEVYASLESEGYDDFASSLRGELFRSARDAYESSAYTEFFEFVQNVLSGNTTVEDSNGLGVVIEADKDENGFVDIEDEKPTKVRFLATVSDFISVCSDYDENSYTNLLESFEDAIAESANLGKTRSYRSWEFDFDLDGLDFGAAEEYLVNNGFPELLRELAESKTK